MLKQFAVTFASILCLPAVLIAQAPADSHNLSLADARRRFATHLIIKATADFPVAQPPPDLFNLVTYKSPVGNLPAYVSRVPNDGKKHPAIIWIVGGFSNSISDVAWAPASATNDQSASVFWKKGIVTMYPSLRGGNENPGYSENFFGEVDDVLAAADYLSRQSDVDPDRIYLGGHSTGGTLVLLTAECSPRFRAVFSFGPIDDIMKYGLANLYYAVEDKRETYLRSPGAWLSSVHSPVFAFEGTKSPSNIAPLRSMEQSNQNPAIRFFEVANATHFTGLHPVSSLIADKILKDTGHSTNIEFTSTEIDGVIKAP
jgi:hypothetical protein